MPRVSQAHLDARRQQIIDAAKRCFARSGIRETTIQEICQESQLSAGAIYRYFPSKQEILYAAFESFAQQNRETTSHLERHGDPVEGLRRVIAGMPNLFADPSRMDDLRLSLHVHSEGLRDPSIAEKYTAIHREAVFSSQALLHSMQAEGQLAPDVDTEYLAWLIIALNQGWRVHQLLDPGLDGVRLWAVCQRLLDGVLKPSREM